MEFIPTGAAQMIEAMVSICVIVLGILLACINVYRSEDDE